MDKAELADTVKVELRAIIRTVLRAMAQADNIEMNPKSACESITEWTAEMTNHLDDLRKILKGIDE